MSVKDVVGTKVINLKYNCPTLSHQDFLTVPQTCSAFFLTIVVHPGVCIEAMERHGYHKYITYNSWKYFVSVNICHIIHHVFNNVQNEWYRTQPITITALESGGCFEYIALEWNTHGKEILESVIVLTFIFDSYVMLGGEKEAWKNATLY